MGLRLLLSIIALSLCSAVFGLRAYFDYKVFHIPGEGSYVEFITSFDGATFLLAARDSNQFQSNAEMTIVINHFGTISDYRKVTIDGPLVLQNKPADFISIERIMLLPGTYNVEIEIKDLNNASGKLESFSQPLIISAKDQSAFFSDIEMVSAYRKTEDINAFSKSGYDLLPYISNYFPKELNSLIYYVEMYGSDSLFGEGNPFVSVVFITKLNDTSWEFGKRIKREKAAAVVPLLQTLNIGALATGEYILRAEMRNGNNDIIAFREEKFSRNQEQLPNITGMPMQENQHLASFADEFNDRDSLYDILQAHLPIAKGLDRSTIDTQLESADLATLQSFFYSFWQKRAPENPAEAWRNYQEQLKIVNQNFATRNKPGWRTDRGRVYLQYGAPNTRTVRPSDTKYWPFEIWFYYETNNSLHDRRFLFYDNTLSGDMTLLHSDVPTEVRNFNWLAEVGSRGNLGGSSQQNSTQNADTHSRDEIEELWFTPH